MTGRWQAAMTAVVCAAVALSGGSISAFVATQEVPAIGGGWKLNAEASTNPNGPPAVRPPAAPRGGRGGGGGIGSGAGDIAGGAVSSADGGALGAEEMQRFNGHKNLLFQAPPLLGIKATREQVIILTDPDPSKGMAFSHATDNKAKDFPTPFGPMAIKAKWDREKFRREIETRESLKVIEEYTVSADGRQLFVTVKASSGMVRNVQNGDIRRVYDRVQ